MKQRSFVVAALAMIPFAVAAAQTPPVKPAPATAPVARPVTPATPLIPLYPDGYIDRDEIRRAAEEARYQGQIAAEDGRRIAEEARRAAEDARWQIQNSLGDMRLDFDHNFNFNFDHNFDFKFDAPNFGVTAPKFELLPSGQYKQQWQDPADSAYEVALQSINRQDYSRAAAKFAEFVAKFPNSRRVPQAAYYQALALFRVGTMETLRNSLKVLESNAQLFQYSYNSSRTPSEAIQLQARVLRALAERGENGAETKLRDLIAKYPTVSCDDDKISIQAQVLSSLYQTDPESALPYIRDYLKTKDACTAELRRSAIQILSNKGTDENTNLILQAAKNDTVQSVRLRAIEALSRMPGDGAVNALQQLMNDPDERVQSAAVRSLMRNDNPRARAAMRMSVIDKKDAPERQRTEAIRSFSSDNMTPDDATYLRNLFNRAGESDNVKYAIVQALGSVPTEENLKFLMDVTQNQNESSTIRSYALRRVTSRQNLSTDNLIKLYDATDNRGMRNSLVDALAQRPEPAAVNKLLEIVKSSTDPEVRKNAIQDLLRKNDKAITQKVLDLIGKPSGGL
jgi:HEAT repeat protein